MWTELIASLRLADQSIAAGLSVLLLPLGAYILFSAFDDLLLDMLWARFQFRQVPPRRPRSPSSTPRRIAIYIPLWREADVIGRMLTHNLAAIDYPDYDIFAGVYRNDAETRAAIEEILRQSRHVHLAGIPHDGPTSKADCLNWIHQGALLYEEENGCRFDVVVIHDAEDIIHPRSLALIDDYSRGYDMVQLPVLPLGTPWLDWTHGLYCDDFAESQTRELPVRTALGGFLPGCGVGTAIRREAIDLLARSDSNRVFDPLSLTEDYENGLRLFKLGCTQAIVPLAFESGAPVATREYFPRRWRQSVRQRSRWILGNSIQAWQKHGWGRGMRRWWVQGWFLWRDRKGLWGSAVALLCNFAFLYGSGSLLWSLMEARRWPLGDRLHTVPLAGWIVAANVCLLLERLLVRSICSGRVYGWVFALGVPLRMLWGNWINFRSSFAAIRMWLVSRLRHQPLRWLKTEHAYPGRDALRGYKRRLGDILVAEEFCTRQQVEVAAATRPEGRLLGEFLMETGNLTENDLYFALSLQHSLPVVELNPEAIPVRVARSLPETLVRECEVLPFRVAGGELELATPHIPGDAIAGRVQRLTGLKARFHLAPRSGFNNALTALLSLSCDQLAQSSRRGAARP